MRVFSVAHPTEGGSVDMAVTRWLHGGYMVRLAAGAAPGSVSQGRAAAGSWLVGSFAEALDTIKPFQAV